MADDLTAFVKSVLHDEDVAKILQESPKLRTLVKRLYNEARRISGDDDDDSLFPVKNGAETRFLKTRDILFFESRGRKIALRTKAQEIVFYSNFEQISEQVPEHFMRCHRGYIVNTRKIQAANFAENTIAMAEGSIVPFSRTYRDAVRERIENIGGGMR
jgi:DNA-binding LytR/AlgR family response regulator